MPTFTVTEGLDASPGYHSGDRKNATQLLEECSRQVHSNCEQMLHSSFSATLPITPNLDGSPNGFVWAVIQAYNQHRNLVIRPDDVWLAILTQLNLHINNTHAEELRGKFVAHDGQRELEIVHDGPLDTYDWEGFPQKVVDRLGQLVTDRDLQQWILPNFSTTEPEDEAVCSVVMTSTLQHYVRYKLRPRCGLPEVTLLGDKSDWEAIMTRIEKLLSFSDETWAWYMLVSQVISHFIKAFEDPDSTENKDFWQNVAQFRTTNGINYLDGWITAFCYWNDQGEKLQRGPGYQLNRTQYYQVEVDEIPSGFALVNVTIVEDGQQYMARMIAGSMATFGYVNASELGHYGTLQPEIGWCLFETKG